MAPSDFIPRENLRIPVEARAGLIRRLKEGETKKNLAAEFGVTRQYIELLQKKHDQGGDPALLPKKPGRVLLPEGSLNPEQFEAVVALVNSKDTPSLAGLKYKRQPDRWTPVSLRALISRKYRIRLDSGQFALLLDRLGVPQNQRPAGVNDEDFDEDFYAYVDSPLGREVARKEQEMLERDRELIREQPAPPLKSPGKQRGSIAKPVAGDNMKAAKKGPNFQKPKRRKAKKRR
jgi:transposase